MATESRQSGPQFTTFQIQFLFIPTPASFDRGDPQKKSQESRDGAARESEFDGEEEIRGF
jgi:hypothetical protein